MKLMRIALIVHEIERLADVWVNYVVSSMKKPSVSMLGAEASDMAWLCVDVEVR